MRKLNRKKVLLTGAIGYLKQYLVKQFKKRNFWVRVLIRKEAQKDKFNNVDETIAGTTKKITKGFVTPPVR